MTRLAGVLGDPIAHSKSPKVHGHWLARYGIDGHYVPLHVRPDDLADTLRLLPRLGFAGVNVTLPHKEAALALADIPTDRAKAVGAANTLTFQDGLIHADNTDGEGFIRSLTAGAPAWAAAKPALILGAGGAAKGIASALLDAGASRVTIANRTLSRAQALAKRLGPKVTAIDLDAVADIMPSLGLLANTTSLGMSGHGALNLDLSPLPMDAVVTDIVYTPLETGLLADARARGNPAVDGLGMLLHQAAPGFEKWFGVRPKVDADLRRAVLSP